jgi:hypothetical protein
MSETKTLKDKVKKELLKNSHEIIALSLIGLTIGTSFHLFGKPISAESALAFLSSIANISAAILGIFSAAALFLMERSPIAVRRVMPKGDFVSAFVLFALAILHSLASILTIDKDTSVDLRTSSGDILIFLPLMWMTSAIVIVGFFIWKLSLEEPKES